MPCLSIQTSAIITSQEAKNAFLQEASKVVSQALKKPEDYVMVSLTKSDMIFGGDLSLPAAFCSISSIGNINSTNNKKLTADLCHLFETHFAIPSDRIFITFTDVPAGNFGWNGNTFA